jgi:hypothetical protein
MISGLTPAWLQLRYHPKQSKLWREKHKHVIVVAGRGSGKTEVAKRRLVRWLPVIKPWSDPVYFYAAPTREQAKRLAWESLKALIPPSWFDGKPNESELVIRTVFGSRLLILGTDVPARVEGIQYDGGVIDECSDQKPGVFSKSFGPALTHRDPWCWRVGVPKRAGIGAREFKEAFELGASGRDPDIVSYTWPSGDILSESQLRFQMENMDKRDYNEQYNASWETIGGLIFYSYDEVLNETDWVYNPEMPLIVGSDFNVDPMSWVVAQARGKEVWVFDELFIRSTNTRATLTELHRRYPNHKAGWRFFGDASGKARHSSASQSDYLLIKSDVRFENSRVFYPDSNPAVMDRFASCNMLFENVLGVRNLRVHRRCENLRKDLLARAYKEGCNEADDSHPDSGHITDALGYLVYGMHPLSAPFGSGSSGKGITTIA